MLMIKNIECSVGFTIEGECWKTMVNPTYFVKQCSMERRSADVPNNQGSQGQHWYCELPTVLLHIYNYIV